MKYYQITNSDGKQWVMPAKNMRVGMMLYQPSAWTGKMLKALLPWLAWCEIVRKKLYIQVVKCPISPALDRRLQELFGENVLEYAVFNGTPCVHQKQTVQIYCGSRILGYCKISSNPEIVSLFHHEQDYLQWLRDCKLKGVPRCISCEQLPTGECFFVQSTMKSLRSEVDHALGSRQIQFLEQLHTKTKINCTFGDSDLYRSLLRVEHCFYSFNNDEQVVIRQGYDLIRLHFISSEQYTFSAYHSDFTPWNMFVEGGQLFVFDWEYAMRTSLPYLDMIHYLFQSCVFERHAVAEEIYYCLMVENQDLLNRYFDNPKVAVTAYLLDMLGMYAVRDAGNETDGSRQIRDLRIDVLQRVLAKMKKIVCFHLLNDFSGSPKVLKMVLEGMLERGYSLDLVTTRGGLLDALDENPACRIHGYRYSFSTSSVVEILRYGWIQFYTFCLAFRWLFTKGVVFYINTLLPVGPALAGKLMGKRVVYHYHENADAKSGIYRGLCSMMQRLADEIICVSEYQRSFLKRKKGVYVVPNSLPEEFVKKLNPDIEAAFDRKNVLMIGSLKAYKSVKEFVALANNLPQYRFTLVINGELQAIDKYFAEERLCKDANLHVVPRQSDVTSFYNNASLVLNLTNRELAIETFGLTILEAMSAGLPVIVPTVGGIAEMVEDGVNGYKIDVQELDKIEDKVQEILNDKALYCMLAQNALEQSKRYNAEIMIEKIINIVL